MWWRPWSAVAPKMAKQARRSPSLTAGSSHRPSPGPLTIPGQPWCHAPLQLPPSPPAPDLLLHFYWVSAPPARSSWAAVTFESK